MRSLVLMVVLALLSPSIGHALEKPSHAPEEKILFTLTATEDVTCEELLTACEEAIGAAEDVIAAKSAIIEAQARALDAATKRIAELLSDRDSLFKSPWFLLSTGVVLGGGLGIVIKKAF